MRELTQAEVEEVSGGFGPAVIIGIDLALTGVLIGYASFMSGMDS